MRQEKQQVVIADDHMIYNNLAVEQTLEQNFENTLEHSELEMILVVESVLGHGYRNVVVAAVVVVVELVEIGMVSLLVEIDVAHLQIFLFFQLRLRKGIIH
ncbi:unnamed protein product [[Candida] boidinii]|uniref:Unnamed protein product n=1 Tax=Candida boidinii TaxID=5477 RepID=A0ACB5TWP8_CANBO|nr:unnamed protein product [[Candida] boidinii]